MQPYYTPENVKAAYRLRYSWTGWPSIPPLPPEPDDEFFADLGEAFQRDGIRLLERSWEAERVFLLASALPQVSPVAFAARAKGRLQHHLRGSERPTGFSRKVSVRALGENRRIEVERYIEGQVSQAQFADPRIVELLEPFTWRDESVDLSIPCASAHGRYWYLLHLVLVVSGRARIWEEERLRALRNGCLRIARARGHRISAGSIMPDHLHLALAGHIEQSPEAIALCYMNNLAYFLGQSALWMPSYYVATFGEYDLGRIRYLKRAG